MEAFWKTTLEQIHENIISSIKFGFQKQRSAKAQKKENMNFIKLENFEVPQNGSCRWLYINALEVQAVVEDSYDSTKSHVFVKGGAGFKVNHTALSVISKVKQATEGEQDV